ncbi:MAG TPA: DUF4082 domain-containing protein, partial [Terriglobales bacterium]|nr:DUF4082 domain-containing protein [Terriglobales bacterium]
EGTVSGSTVMTVQATPLVITTSSFANGTQNQPYSAAVVATGGTAPYTWSLANGTTLPPGLTLAASSGQISGSPTLAGTFGFTLQVSDGGSPVQTVTKSFSISIASPPAFYTVWAATATPTVADAGADSAVELGFKFKSDISGTISGVRFYKSAGNTGTHIGNLWSAGGSLLATATFSNETASGWQQVNFSSPVAITPGTVYVASYHSTIGHYSDDQNYFTTAGVDNSPLHALQDGISGADGVFAYGASSTFPSSGFNGSNYWVDVVFEPSASLSSIAVTPGNPTIGAGATQAFTATGTYSDGSTQNITSQVAWASANTAVATITSAGVATGVAGGSATITATQGSISGSTLLTVQPATLTITTSALANGTQNVAYSATLNATGGTPPLAWSLANGTTLPAGLSLSGSGSITGTPTVAGTFSFTVQAQDSAVTPQSATRNLSITLAPNACPCTITGTLSGAGGANARVAYSGTSSGAVNADGSGNYTIANLANGSYTVTPSNTGFVFSPASQSVSIAGANVGAVNFTASVQTWSISGTISNGSGASVALSGAATASTTADSSGNYSFSNLANGSYTVTPTKSGYTVNPASQNVTISNANAASVNFTATSNSPGLAMDVNASTDGSTAKSTIASPAFTTKAGNELLLAFVATDYLKGTNTTVTAVAGGGLTWSLVKRTNTQSGSAEIWAAFSAAAVSNATVTATLSQSVVCSITILSFTGVDTTQGTLPNAVGATGSGNSAKGAPTASLVTTRNNSWAFGVGNDFDNAIARTPGGGQTIVHQFLTPTGDTYWVQMQAATTPLSGTTVTINDTAPTTDRYNMSIVEVRTP